MKLIAIVILLFINTSCSFYQKSIIQKPDLIGCWTNSYEENQSFENNQVYRPCDYKEFPPSRFRFIMDLKSDNTCEYLNLSTNDGHQMTSGHWSFDKKTETITIQDKNEKEIKKLIVKKAQKDIVVLENML